MRNNPRATDFVQQVQTVKHPVTGDELEVMIRQYFVSTPGVFYTRNGDPGEPPSCEPIGEPEILMADGSAAPDWVEDALINWDEFNGQDVQPIEREDDVPDIDSGPIWAAGFNPEGIKRSLELSDEYQRRKLLEGDWLPERDNETDALGNNFSDADPGL